MAAEQGLQLGCVPPSSGFLPVRLLTHDDDILVDGAVRQHPVDGVSHGGSAVGRWPLPALARGARAARCS